MSTITESARGAAAYSYSTYPSQLSRSTSPQIKDSAALTQAWTRVIDTLLRIRKLEDDWDGEGSNAPHPALVDGAITLAKNLQSTGCVPPDRVHAGVNATVCFEWFSPHSYCEIEVVSPVEAERRFIKDGSSIAQVDYLFLQPRSSRVWFLTVGPA